MLRPFRSASDTPTAPGIAPSFDAPAPSARALARAAAIVDRVCEPVMVTDALGTIGWLNPAAAALLGDTERLVGTRLTDWLDADDVGAALAYLAEVATDPTRHPVAEWTVRPARGADRVIEVSARDLAHEPSVDGIVLHLHDVTERVAERRRHAFESLHDPLTRLPNRVLLRDRLAHALAVSHRRAAPLTLLLIDVDGFRGLNDIFGRAAGDALLGAVATRLGITLRSSDTAARVGADEFAVLLEQMSDESDFVQITERLLAVISQPVTVSGRELTLSVSVGIANGTPDDDADALLRNAEVALSLAKRRGRGACEIYEPRMHAAIIERLELEADLRRAIETRELSLRFQPIVILHSRRIAGVEVFLHWEHPAHGIVSPSRFLPIADDTGLIIPVGRWALIEACRQAMLWHRDLDQERPLTVTWNVSGVQLLHPGFLTDVSDALRLSGLDPHRLVLEISDDVVTRHANELVPRLHAVKALGVRIAIDEFGTEHSSLRHLPGIPVDILKIDRSFVARVTEYGGEATLAQVIVALGKSLQLRTVADGVEAEEQLGQLLQWRCEFGQGSLFADAGTADDVTLLLRRERQRGP
jgi:diguanylate cyclase (GGDEF)-like protein/PAS domain S-box-containing protein